MTAPVISRTIGMAQDPSLFGNVFLGSVFTGLGQFRDNIWRSIQKMPSLKCVSFQTEHVNRSALNPFLEDIPSAIATSDFFIILIGPRYGESIRDTGWATGVPPATLDKSFGEYEFHLMKDRLESFSDRSRRVLLVNLDDSTTPDARLADMRASAENLRVAPWNISLATFQVFPNGDRFDIVADQNDDWERLLKTFVSRAERIARAEQHQKFLSNFKINPEKHIQVAGWSGIEEPNLYGEFAGRVDCHADSFSFLTMDRSVIELPSSAAYHPRLNHDPLPFDFLFSDIELIKFHRSREYIGPINATAAKTVRDHFRDGFSEIIKPHFSHCAGEDVHAIPLLYGFNELIVHPKLALKPASDSWSYSDFDLPTLFANNAQTPVVGLWGWWASTFPIVLYAHAVAAFQKNSAAARARFKPLTNVNVQSISNFSDWINNTALNNPLGLQKCISSIVTGIIKGIRKDFSQKIFVIRTLETLRNKLCTKQLDVVFGGTSSVLATCDAGADLYKCIRPDEGIYLWINCVCECPKASGEMLGGLVKNWLSEPIQEKLSLGASDPPILTSRPYVGVPALKSAEQNFLARRSELANIHWICETFDEVQERERDPSKGRWLSLRPFPPDPAFLLEFYWNLLLVGLKKKVDLITSEV